MAAVRSRSVTLGLLLAAVAPPRRSLHDHFNQISSM